MSPTRTGSSGSVLTPEEAYAALGNDVRIQIIETLNKADEPLSFTEVFDRLDYDSQPNLTYHLGELVDHFVTKTEAGYRLSWTGKLVARSAILAGRVTRLSQIGPTEVDVDCPLCRAPLVVRYADNILHVRCTDCVGLWAHRTDGKVIGFTAPPQALDVRTVEAAFHALAHRAMGTLAALAHDICPVCGATVDRTVSICTGHRATDQHLCDTCTRRRPTSVRYKCAGCGYGRSKLPAGLALVADGSLDDPFAGYGEAIPRGWAAYDLGLSADAALRATDPFRLRLSLPVDDEPIVVTVDDALSILEHDRPHQ